jgi:hypothetical protein
MAFDPMQYMLQRQQQAMAPLPNPYAGLAEGLSASFQRQYEMDRQRRADDLKAREFEAEQAAAKRKAEIEKLTALDKMAGHAALAKQGETAASLYNQGRELRQGLYGFAGPEIVGSINPNVYDVETQQPMRTFGEQSMQTVLGLTGTQAPKPILVPQGQTALDSVTHQPFFTAPLYRAVGSDRTGRQIVDLTKAQPGTPITAPVVPAGRGGGGGGRSSGGGSHGGSRGHGAASRGRGEKLVDGMTKAQRDWVIAHAKANASIDDGMGKLRVDKDLFTKHYQQMRQSVIAGTAGPDVVAGPPKAPPGYKPPSQKAGPPAAPAKPRQVQRPSGVPSPRALMKAIVGNQNATIEIEDD